MERQSKRLLKLALFLAITLIALLYLKQKYFDADFRIKYVTEGKSIEKGRYRFTADVSLYQFSSYEGQMLVSTDFFSDDFIPNFPYRLGDWVGKDIEHQYADISLFRLYHHPKKNLYLWLIIVYGGHDSKFHAGEVCYISDGWDVAYREVKQITVSGTRFPLRYFISQKNGSIHTTAYWYLWPNSKRRISDGTLMFRLSAESNASEAQGQEALQDFMTQMVNLRLFKKEGDVHEQYAGVDRGAPPVAIKKQARSNAVLHTIRDKTISWILKQRVPNKVVPYPQMNRRYLLLSYELNKNFPRNENDRSYRYIYSRSAIYDNALALIALAMAKRYQEAEGIIEAVSRVMQSSGELWFSYNTHDDWPSDYNHKEAIIRSGASSWMGYAIMYYIRRRLLDEPKWIKKQNARSYLKIATKITDALLKRQIRNSSDPRYGAITGGWGSHELKLDASTKKVIEKYKTGDVNWASIEHNLDFYFLLKNLFQVTRNRKYKIAMTKVRDALLRAWNSQEGQFNRELRKEGPDMSMALDCASWGYMFAKAVGEQNKLPKLMSAMKHYKVTDSVQGVKGYRPYYKGLVYDELSINKIVYPHRPKKSWSDVDMVWSEGSFGVAMAYLKAGNVDAAEQIIWDILKMQVNSGGIRYATQEIPFQFSPSPSMAGTAWMAMVLFAMEDQRLLDLFWN